jgi:predicted phage terminase large subunit-like protein
VIRLRRQWSADKVIIEDAGSGKSLWQEFRTQGPFIPLMWKVATSKEERFVGSLGEIEAGIILLPNEAPWLETFRSELRAFPSGRHDDQVDSMTQFIQFQLKNWKWTLTDYDASGRARAIVRLRERPY